MDRSAVGVWLADNYKMWLCNNYKMWLLGVVMDRGCGRSVVMPCSCFVVGRVVVLWLCHVVMDRGAVGVWLVGNYKMWSVGNYKMWLRRVVVRCSGAAGRCVLRRTHTLVAGVYLDVEIKKSAKRCVR